MIPLACVCPKPDPEPVMLLITGELVGAICANCFASVPVSWLRTIFVGEDER